MPFKYSNVNKKENEKKKRKTKNGELPKFLAQGEIQSQSKELISYFWASSLWDFINIKMVFANSNAGSENVR